MSPAQTENHRLIDWAAALRPLAGQTVSGDMHLVEPLDHAVLLAVIDGVGHGDEAAVAAQAAVAVLKEHPGEPVIALIKRCHTALTRTRGVAMTMASLNVVDDTVTWLGVGNVEGRLLRADAGASHPTESVLLRGGMVGFHLPVLYASILPVAPGDLLMFATDGIEPAFAEGVNQNESPQRIADDIMARYFKGNDDALVLVARHLGFPP